MEELRSAESQPQDVQCVFIPRANANGPEAKLEGGDSCDVVLHVLQMDEVSDQMEQLDEARGTDGVQVNELEGLDEEVRELIEAQLLSADPIVITSSGGTALHRAAERGLERVVARLLAVCPPLINMIEKRGEPSDDTVSDWTTLHCAVVNGHAAIVTQLLTVNPSLIDVDVQWSRNIHSAVKHPAIMSQLLAIKPALIDDEALLHEAMSVGHPAVVAQLLALKPTLIHAVTGRGWTVLHQVVAAAKYEPATVAHLLAAKPTLIDAKDNEGKTALHLAVAQGHGEIVSQLLSASPTLIEARDNNGRTVLHFAVSARRNEIIAQVFAAHPTSLEAMINDADSWTALQYVVGVGHEEAVARVLAMHPHLIHGTAPYFGWTVFHFAAFYDRPKVVSQVVSHVLAAGVSQSENDFCFEDPLKCMKEYLKIRRPCGCLEGPHQHNHTTIGCLSHTRCQHVCTQL